MKPEIDVLLGLLDEAFDKRAWHGPNLRGSLRGLTPALAAWRPGAGRHNIWEIAVHAAYWKYAVRRHLTGEKRGSFPLPGSNWFERPSGEAAQPGWRRDVAILLAEHRQLRDVVATLPLRRLHETSAGSRHSNLALIRGAASHDLYHAGQIQLLKRLRGSSQAPIERAGKPRRLR